MKRIPRTLHAPALQRTENNKTVALTFRISRTFHAPASRHAENNEKVTTYAQNFEDAPRASITTRRKTTRWLPLTSRISRMLHAPASRRAENNEMVATYVQNFEDAPRASVRTQDMPETARRSPLTSRISRMLHAPASRRAENNESVATYVQNFEDAPRASVTTRRKQREGRHLRPEFRGSSTLQRHDAPKATKGSLHMPA